MHAPTINRTGCGSGGGGGGGGGARGCAGRCSGDVGRRGQRSCSGGCAERRPRRSKLSSLLPTGRLLVDKGRRTYRERAAGTKYVLGERRNEIGREIFGSDRHVYPRKNDPHAQGWTALLRNLFFYPMANRKAAWDIFSGISTTPNKCLEVWVGFLLKYLVLN